MEKAAHPSILTIDRAGTRRRRSALVAEHAKVPGKELNDYPPAMFREGGIGASIRHIDPADNRGFGAFIGNQCRPYPDGTKLRLVVEP